jgi:hypothetical protein
LRRDLGGGFDGLRGRCDGADDDFVGIHVAACAGAILVSDLPGRSGDLLAGCGRVVLGVACALAGWSLGRKHPTMRL